MRPSRLGAYALAAGVLVVVATAVVAHVYGTPAPTPAPIVPNAALRTSFHDDRLSENWFGAAPYVMPTEQRPPQLADVMAATGQKAFTMAFVRAPNAGGCEPTWGGYGPVSTDTAANTAINTVRGAGGDVALAFGGPSGTKLGEACASAEATADAFQQAIDRYSVKAVDLDLERPGYDDPAVLARELGAAQILQRRNPSLSVFVTLPVTSAGTGSFGQQVLAQAKSIGFAPNSFTISASDGGISGAASMVGALEAFHGLLMNTFGWDATTAYAREGFSGTSGKSTASDLFEQADFKTILDYAIGHKLGRYTFSSVNRDRPCATPGDAGTCSGIPQDPWEFTRFTAQFGNATTPTVGATRPAPPPEPAEPPAPPVTTPPATPCSAPPQAAPNTAAKPPPPPAGTGTVLRAGASYEAETNTRSGRAVVYNCSGCSGYNKVGQLGNNSGAISFNSVTVNQSGTYRLTIAYVDADAGRSALVTVNGSSGWMNFPGTRDGDWNTVQTMTVSVQLNAGSNTISISNPHSDAPDIDRITL